MYKKNLAHLKIFAGYNRGLNNNAVSTLWNTPYYICTNIIKSIKIVCVCVGGGGVRHKNLYCNI